MRFILATAIVTAACVASGACGSAAPPTAPSVATVTTVAPSIPSALPGVWHVYVRAVSCDHPGICGTEQTIPFVLRVAAAGTGFDASFEINWNTNIDDVLSATGVTQPDGSIVFAGVRGPYGTNQSSLELRRLAVKTDAAAGLTGEIDLQRSGGSQTMTGAVTSASYQPFTSLAGQSFSGSWSGMALIRACSGSCPRYLDAGHTLRVNLALAESGTAITGSLRGPAGFSNWVPLTGSVSGSTFSVASDAFHPTSGSVRNFRLEHFDGTPDVVGRLTGTFTYSADDTIAIAPFNISYRLDLDILWLTRD